MSFTKPNARRVSVAALALAVLPVTFLAMPPEPQAAPTDDWPCIQRRVPELSLGAVWSGPEIDPQSLAWMEDPEVKTLVNLLAIRRTPLEKAEAEIAKFADAHAAVKNEKLTAVFTGLFQRASSERRQIMDGIVRYNQRQEALAERIRKLAHELTVLEQKQEKTDDEAERSKELRNQIEWDTRIFEAREQSLTAVCESPVIIEQRLFALSRAIQGAMQS